MEQFTNVSLKVLSTCHSPVPQGAEAERPLCQVRAISCDFQTRGADCEQATDFLSHVGPAWYPSVTLLSVQQLFLEGERSWQAEEGIPFGRWITWWEWLGLRGLAAERDTAHLG